MGEQNIPSGLKHSQWTSRATLLFGTTHAAAPRETFRATAKETLACGWPVAVVSRAARKSIKEIKDARKDAISR